MCVAYVRRRKGRRPCRCAPRAPPQPSVGHLLLLQLFHHDLHVLLLLHRSHLLYLFKFVELLRLLWLLWLLRLRRRLQRRLRRRLLLWQLLWLLLPLLPLLLFKRLPVGHHVPLLWEHTEQFEDGGRMSFAVEEIPKLTPHRFVVGLRCHKLKVVHDALSFVVDVDCRK